MGMTLGYVEVTPQQLDGVLNDGEKAEELYDEIASEDDALNGFVEKAWDGLQYLLDRAGVDVDLRMDGEPIDYDGEEYTGFDADLVRSIADALDAAPFEKLAAHYDPADMMARNVYPGIWDSHAEDELEYLRENYDTLRTFFATAARNGNAALGCFSF
ncbi:MULTISPECIES: YfbM family protein [Amycolatopsis]|uniref:YfbM family protein n=1 Tax=Amycolatopsis thermalba TaxID=944492 RepID=A0ABY4NPY8_9PSEU|nr:MULTISPECIES: YfbM family protein [Amycolatopsis]UQS21557.1 YfbM family protein [Amycolatopsis thermalba]